MMIVALDTVAWRHYSLYQRRSFIPRVRVSPPQRCLETRLLESSVERELEEDPRPLNGHYVQNLHLVPVCYDMKLVKEKLKYDYLKQSKDTAPDDFYPNFGKAIETINHDFPRLFQKDFDYSIFRDDLVFRDPINSFQGKKFYQYMLLSLRWHGRVFFKRVYVRIHSLQPRPEGSIKVRWSMHGIPRIPWEAEGVFDGISEYQLDRHGKVYEHSVDNIIFRDPPVFNLPVFFAQISVRNSVQAPIPRTCYNSNHINDMVFLMNHFSWVRLYFVLSVVNTVLHTYTHHHQKQQEDKNQLTPAF